MQVFRRDSFLQEVLNKLSWFCKLQMPTTTSPPRHTANKSAKGKVTAALFDYPAAGAWVFKEDAYSLKFRFAMDKFESGGLSIEDINDLEIFSWLQDPSQTDKVNEMADKVMSGVKGTAQKRQSSANKSTAASSSSSAKKAKVEEEEDPTMALFD